MCGIAGVLGNPGPARDRSALAAAMVKSLVHRGPDHFGCWADPSGSVGLGFQRLAILDLSPEGHQPMASVDGRYTVVFNGEIYNWAALKDELAAIGWGFRGRSDTEILLAAITQWGLEATLPRIWGMFAVAVWDGRDRRLHLVRDRLGKKPLYYGWQGDEFLFGSELKALRSHPGFAAPIDRQALTSFTRFSYVPAPESIYQGIRKLLPGSWVSIDPASRTLPEPRRYWDPVAVAELGQHSMLAMDDIEAADELENLLRDAVGLRAIADVPLGAFLSGGIDSSTVVALLQAQSSRRVSTFTIGYDASEYDESQQARAVADHLGTDHTELLVSPEETRAVIPRLGRMFDEPFADASQIPTYLVSELARRSVTVALSGDGGDEVFGGYNRYVTGSRLRRRLRRVPAPLLQGAASLAAAIPPMAWDRVGSLADRMLPTGNRGVVTGNNMQKLASVLDAKDADTLFARLVSTWQDPASVVCGGSEPEPPWRTMGAAVGGLASRMMLLDLMGYLPDDVLAKVDRASMATSLEVRAPLLDHRVVEFAWRLPIHQKIRGAEGKFILKRVLERHVPAQMFRRPKHGFGVPIDTWLRGPLRAWAEDLLTEDRLRRDGFFEPSIVRGALREHLAGRRNNQYRLWTILMFQVWLDETRGSPQPT
jgi:asparagine synthase (glutamine-hydrolysing)